MDSLEKKYEQKFLDLFAQVDAKRPERGITLLFKRARKRAEHKGISYESALAIEYAGAKQRTEARLRLILSCNRSAEM